MQQRYHAERKHLIQSLDALLHQLFCLSYYLSPSMFALLLRLSAQVMCRSPREMFPTLPLGGFLLVLLCFNGLSLYRHATHGAMEGGAIILDFVGLAYSPSKLQLLTTDLSILCLQMLLTILSFDLHASKTTNSSHLSTTSQSPLPHAASPTSSSFLTTYMSRQKTSGPADTSQDYVIDIQLIPLLGRLRSTPPALRQTAQDSLLPLPSTTTWPMPSRMSLFMRANRMQNDRPNRESSQGGTNTIPGEMERE